jgi:hypothetical protein
LASPYTWNLAQKDLFGSTTYYDTQDATPYVHIFCGTDTYEGLRTLVSTPGADGTVRQAGAGFNVRKIVIDLTKMTSVLNPEKKANVKRWRIDDWRNADIPVHLVEGLNHGTILTNPTDELVALVRSAIQIDSAAAYADWLIKADARVRFGKARDGLWQQFIVRAYDERQDPITDYNLQLFTDKDNSESRVDEFDKNVDVYSKDSSYRCFFVDLNKFRGQKTLWLSVLAQSGSQWVNYEGFDSEADANVGPITSRNGWDAWLDLSALLGDGDGFLSPFTTTLVELYIDREPTDKLVKLSG